MTNMSTPKNKTPIVQSRKVNDPSSSEISEELRHQISTKSQFLPCKIMKPYKPKPIQC